jgi:O-antigen/teichoic acid export membrane protein
VFFPAAAKMQDARDQLFHFYKRYLHFISFLSTGASGLLYLITPDLFRLLFTAKWDIAASYFQVMCVAGFVWPMSALMVTLISGVGNSKAFFKLSVIRIIIQLPVYIIGLSVGIIYFLWIMVAFRIISLSLNAIFVSRELKIKISEQLLIILLYFLQGIIAVMIAGLFVKYVNIDNSTVHILMITLVYCGVYITTQYFIKTNAFKEMVFLYRRLAAKG